MTSTPTDTRMRWSRSLFRRLVAGLIIVVAVRAAEPLAFDHKLHGSLKQSCEQCHPGAKKSERAGLPAASKCATCHPGRQIVVPSVSTKRLRDFVFFSHSRHSEAKLECSSCHGDVARNGDVLKQLTMKSCVDCHKGHGATIQCHSCHELGQ